ncbi:MAG: slipin family protein [Anaerolineae bacterium]|jgi:regulator of protease activity HflC (stomatin/prohibitin superfamily)
MIQIIGIAAAAGIAFLLFIIWPAIKVVQQWERGVVLRFGRLTSVRGPGLNLIIPWVDRMVKVDLRVETLVLEPQEVITRDNVTVHVDAVVYFKVIDAKKAVIEVRNYAMATTQIALTTLRSVLGQSELDELLAHRDRVNERLREIIDEHTEEPWGVEVVTVEVKDVLLPEAMQRAMARQAESEREKRGKIIHADGELAAAKKLVQAGDMLASQPVSLELRYLQTLVEMAGERTNTIIPIPLAITRSLMPLLGEKAEGS